MILGEISCHREAPTTESNHKMKFDPPLYKEKKKKRKKVNCITFVLICRKTKLFLRWKENRLEVEKPAEARKMGNFLGEMRTGKSSNVRDVSGNVGSRAWAGVWAYLRFSPFPKTSASSTNRDAKKQFWKSRQNPENLLKFELEPADVMRRGKKKNFFPDFIIPR